MKLYFYIPLIACTFALGACSTLEQASNAMQTAIAPVVVKETLPQICQEAKSNQVKATDYYAGKRISVTGELKSINERTMPRYQISLKTQNVHIFTGTDKLSEVKQLVVGKVTTVVGTISNVSNDKLGCSIALKDSVFNK